MTKCAKCGHKCKLGFNKKIIRIIKVKKIKGKIEMRELNKCIGVIENEYAKNSRRNI